MALSQALINEGLVEMTSGSTPWIVKLLPVTCGSLSPAPEPQAALAL